MGYTTVAQPSAGEVAYLLLEDGACLLQENGKKIILEGSYIYNRIFQPSTPTYNTISEPSTPTYNTITRPTF